MTDWEAGAVLSTLAALLVLANLCRLRGRLLAARRLTGALVVILGFLTIRALLDLLRHLGSAGPAIPGTVLLHLASNIWLDNILTFALAYWLVDRGGPPARASGEGARRREWLFPEEAAQVAPPGWQPRFLDYLFLALTTATAFSPTDTPPLTTRARAMMAVESLTSLVTLALVAARAVNVLA